MEHRLELMADELRDARSRFQLLHVVDQLDQDPLPVVGFAEEPPIEPARQLRPEAQADDRRANQIQIRRVGPQQLPDRLIAVHEHAVGQTGNRQGEQDAQRVLRQQILQAASDDERDVEDVVLDHRVAETDRNQHGREVHQRVPPTEVDRHGAPAIRVTRAVSWSVRNGVRPRTVPQSTHRNRRRSSSRCTAR